MSITFDVIDLSCETTDQSFFPAHVSMVTRSQTKIATVYGYGEYIASTPPKRYHKLTWSGTANQVLVATFTTDIAASAQVVYGGTGEIGVNGVQLTHYTKDLYTPCPESAFQPEPFDPSSNVFPGGMRRTVGYCWAPDPQSCPVCNDPVVFKANVQQNVIFDVPENFIHTHDGVHAMVTATTYDHVGTYFLLFALQKNPPTVGGVINFPTQDISGIIAAWVNSQTDYDIHAVLSNEYTDAEALANAIVINSTGSTAQSFPRTTGDTSQWTTVAYDLNFSNLIIGKDYVASVNLLSQNPYSNVIKQYGFTASAETHVIHDSIAVPPNGGSTTVRNPTVSFAPP